MEERNLPLRCLVCNAKILRVKNNSRHGGGGDHPVHSMHNGRIMPKSVSGYSLGNGNNGGNGVGIRHSQSSYSMSSGVKMRSNDFMNNVSVSCLIEP